MLKKEGLISALIGGIGLIIAIVVVVLIKNKDSFSPIKGEAIYGAIGGGKEDLLADEEINEIFGKDYGFHLVQDSWSNGRTVIDPLLREDGSKYDLVFFSDERFYNEYQKRANPSLGQAERYPFKTKEIILNTPIVLYSWDEVVDVLIKEKIVTQKDGVYYVTDMNKLIDYILEDKKWKDIGLDIYGSVNIGSVDPVTSSPGATYYGLLLQLMTNSNVNEETFKATLPKLKAFYKKSGYMNNAPADLFSKFLKTGIGLEPIIVDYEKSLIDFANKDPEGWAQVKDKVRILYPEPTIWNSHCIGAFTDAGGKLITAFQDKTVSQKTWSRYGFRVGQTGGSYDISKIGYGKNATQIKGIPSEIRYVTKGLNIEYYDKLIEYLKN